MQLLLLFFGQTVNIVRELISVQSFPFGDIGRCGGEGVCASVRYVNIDRLDRMSMHFSFNNFPFPILSQNSIRNSLNIQSDYITHYYTPPLSPTLDSEFVVFV